jgi:hypothetical protein
VSTLKQLGTLTLSLLAAAGFGCLSVDAIGLQHEWGYGLIRDTIGQVYGNGQWLGSAIMRSCFIAPMCAGLSFGYLKQHFHGASWWRIASALLPVSLSTFLLFGDSPRSISEILKPENLVLVFAIFGLYFAGMFAGEKVFSELAKRTRVWRILLPGMLLFLPLSGINQLECMREDGTGWMWEMLADGALIFAATSYASHWFRARSFATGLTVALFCAMPLVLSNSWNVISDLTELAFTRDANGVAALASAVSISMWALLCSAAGGYVGHLTAKRHTAQ